jgi:uncharacterized membrane protein YdjX (TVP38/TMEM64 family)
MRRARLAGAVFVALLLGAPLLAGLVALVWPNAVAGSGVTGAVGSSEWLEARILASGAWAPAASVALMVIHTVLPFPAELLAIANGVVFGFWLGLALTWGGAMLGALSAFALARGYGRPFVQGVLAERHWQRMEHWRLRAGPGGLLVLRLLPVVSFNLVNLVAGIAGVGWWTFAWTTAIGVLPASVACVLAGSRMLEAPFEAAALLSGLLLLAVGLHWWWRRRHGGRTGTAVG